MSAAPPPPPMDGPGGGYPPNARDAWKAQKQMLRAQRRAMKYQARTQRAQWKLQRRALRRRSIVGPLVLLFCGVLLFLSVNGRISGWHLVDWYTRWWPMVLVAAGIILLLEWAFDRARNEDNPAGVRTLGAGVVLLLIFLAALGIGLRYSDTGIAWKNHWFGPGWMGLAEAMGQEHDADSASQHAIAAGARLLIEDPHGDVTVTGNSTDGQVHVSTHKQVWTFEDSDANTREQRLEPAFSGDASHLSLSVSAVNGGQADLTIQVPPSTAITVNAGHGAVNVSNLQANVVLTADHGDVDATSIGGSVAAHMNDDDASLSAQKISGDLTLEGHAGDTTLSDVGGAVIMRGDFFGSTQAERVHGAFRLSTSRTEFELERIDGTLEVSSESYLEAHDVLGPVLLKTRNRNITLDRVQGSVDITNQNGTINVTQTKPLAGVHIDNAHGSVTVGLAEGQGFVLNASTRHGDIENDFGLAESESGTEKSLSGTVAGGGPAVSVKTTDGDITLQKSAVEPLPPPPPPPPEQADAVPAAPPPPSSPKKPGKSHPPSAPASVNF